MGVNLSEAVIGWDVPGWTGEWGDELSAVEGQRLPLSGWSLCALSLSKFSICCLWEYFRSEKACTATQSQTYRIMFLCWGQCNSGIICAYCISVNQYWKEAEANNCSEVYKHEKSVYVTLFCSSYSCNKVEEVIRCQWQVEHIIVPPVPVQLFTRSICLSVTYALSSEQTLN